MAHEFIEINDVSVNYEINNLLAVSGLDMKIKSGSFSAVVGPSGCGKSTLMKILSGLIKPTTGNVKINNSEVTGPQNFVGMAFQNPVMMPWRKTLENVLIPFEILKQNKSKKKNIEEAIKLLEKPSTIVHVLRDDLSVRTGKYGLYIFYKTKKMTRPKFYKLDDYNMDTYDKDDLLKWIKKKSYTRYYPLILQVEVVQDFQQE